MCLCAFLGLDLLFLNIQPVLIQNEQAQAEFLYCVPPRDGQKLIRKFVGNRWFVGSGLSKLENLN